MLNEYGVPGILVLLIIREVFGFVKFKMNGKGTDSSILIREIHSAHLGPQALDKDNNPKWYGTSMELQTKRHNELIGIQTRILKAIEGKGV